MSSPKDLKIIHALKRTLGLNENEYREMMNTQFGVVSSKDLTEPQAKIFINQLRRAANQGDKPANPHLHLDNRPGFASAAQLGLIEGKWSEVSFSKDKRKALESFLKRRFNINGLSWIRQHQVRGLVRTIDAMAEQISKKGAENGNGK